MRSWSILPSAATTQTPAGFATLLTIFTPSLRTTLIVKDVWLMMNLSRRESRHFPIICKPCYSFMSWVVRELPSAGGCPWCCSQRTRHSHGQPYWVQPQIRGNLANRVWVNPLRTQLEDSWHCMAPFGLLLPTRDGCIAQSHRSTVYARSCTIGRRGFFGCNLQRQARLSALPP